MNSDKNKIMFLDTGHNFYSYFLNSTLIRVFGISSCYFFYFVGARAQIPPHHTAHHQRLLPWRPWGSSQSLVVAVVGVPRRAREREPPQTDFLLPLDSPWHPSQRLSPKVRMPGERILKVTKKSGNRGRCRKLSL